LCGRGEFLAATERRHFGAMDHWEGERENQQREEHGWVLKGKHGSTGRRIRKSARPGTEWGGGAGGSARAAWRPFGASARRGGRGDGQRGYCKRWEEAQRDAWSGVQKGAVRRPGELHQRRSRGEIEQRRQWRQEEERGRN
jgi:hypothetical protein